MTSWLLVVLIIELIAFLALGAYRGLTITQLWQTAVWAVKHPFRKPPEDL